MQIFVKTPRGKVLTLEVEGGDTVESLRAQIAAHGFPASLQRLFFTDHLGDVHTLTDGQTLSHYSVQRESELTLGMKPPPKPVYLNVGGVRHDTLLSTLCVVRGRLNAVPEI
jgi:hypothetical protein